jgi:Zn-dependent protease
MFSVIVHEISHGYIAEYLGDPTARLAGRLTLNPISHIDPFGSIILPLLLAISGLPVVGMARPVPYNPMNLYKDYKYGPLKVALAGPFSNFLMMLIFGMLGRFIFVTSPILAAFFGFIAMLNAFLAVFNLVPIPPLDGSKILTVLFPGSIFTIERFSMVGFVLVLVFVYLFSGVVFTAAAGISGIIMGPNVFRLVLQTF